MHIRSAEGSLQISAMTSSQGHNTMQGVMAVGRKNLFIEKLSSSSGEIYNIIKGCTSYTGDNLYLPINESSGHISVSVKIVLSVIAGLCGICVIAVLVYRLRRKTPEMIEDR